MIVNCLQVSLCQFSYFGTCTIDYTILKDKTNMNILRKIIFLLLIAAGVVLILLPTYSKVKLHDEVQTAVKVIEEVTPEEIKENETRERPEEIFDFEQVEEISPTATFMDNAPFDKSLLIGQIVIPSLDLNLCIFKGTTNYNLLRGVGTMKPDDTMGKGNYTLAGHNNGDKSLLFGSLMSIKKGAKVRITDKTNIYEYSIYDTKIVPNTSLELLDNTESDKVGKPIISLMTCDKGSWTSNRFFALGKLIKKYKYDKAVMESK